MQLYIAQLATAILHLMTFYLAELFRQAAFYLTELSRQIAFSKKQLQFVDHVFKAIIFLQTIVI